MKGGQNYKCCYSERSNGTAIFFGLLIIYGSFILQVDSSTKGPLTSSFFGKSKLNFSPDDVVYRRDRNINIYYDTINFFRRRVRFFDNNNDKNKNINLIPNNNNNNHILANNNHYPFWSPSRIISSLRGGSFVDDDTNSNENSSNQDYAAVGVIVVGDSSNNNNSQNNNESGKGHWLKWGDPFVLFPIHHNNDEETEEPSTSSSTPLHITKSATTNNSDWWGSGHGRRRRGTTIRTATVVNGNVWDGNEMAIQTLATTCDAMVVMIESSTAAAAVSNNAAAAGGDDDDDDDVNINDSDLLNMNTLVQAMERAFRQRAKQGFKSQLLVVLPIALDYEQAATIREQLTTNNFSPLTSDILDHLDIVIFDETLLDKWKNAMLQDIGSNTNRNHRASGLVQAPEFPNLLSRVCHSLADGDDNNDADDEEWNEWSTSVDFVDSTSDNSERANNEYSLDLDEIGNDKELSASSSSPPMSTTTRITTTVSSANTDDSLQCVGKNDEDVNSNGDGIVATPPAEAIDVTGEEVNTATATTSMKEGDDEDGENDDNLASLNVNGDGDDDENEEIVIAPDSFQDDDAHDEWSASLTENAEFFHEEEHSDDTVVHTTDSSSATAATTKIATSRPSFQENEDDEDDVVFVDDHELSSAALDITDTTTSASSHVVEEDEVLDSFQETEDEEQEASDSLSYSETVVADDNELPYGKVDEQPLIDGVVVAEEEPPSLDIVEFALSRAREQLDQLEAKQERIWLSSNFPSMPLASSPLLYEGSDDDPVITTETTATTPLSIEFGAEADKILEEVSNMLDEHPLRHELLMRLAKDHIKPLFLEHLQSLREYYGKQYENMLEAYDSKHRKSANQRILKEYAKEITEEFRSAALHAIPTRCSPAGELRDPDFEYVFTLQGLLSDMMQSTEIYQEQYEAKKALRLMDDDDYGYFDDEEDYSGRRRGGGRRRQRRLRRKLRRLLANKWYTKYGARLLILGVNYFQGWLAYQGIKRAALERDRNMPKFPLF